LAQSITARVADTTLRAGLLASLGFFLVNWRIRC